MQVRERTTAGRLRGAGALRAEDQEVGLALGRSVEDHLAWLAGAHGHGRRDM